MAGSITDEGIVNDLTNQFTSSLSDILFIDNRSIKSKHSFIIIKQFLFYDQRFIR